MKILDPACGSKMFWFDKHEPQEAPGQMSLLEGNGK